MVSIIKSLGCAGALFTISILAAPHQKGAYMWEHTPNIAWEPTPISLTAYFGQQTSTFLPMATIAALEASVAASGVQDDTLSPHNYYNGDYHHHHRHHHHHHHYHHHHHNQTDHHQTDHQHAQTTIQMPTPTAQSIPAASSIITAGGEPSGPNPAATSSVSSGYNGPCSKNSPCTGDITYYDTATTISNPSACGTTNNGETELVLALPQGIMTDSDCGKTVNVTYGGTTKTGTVVDKCMGCDNNSIDLSRKLFEALAGSLYAGRISGVEWYIN